MKTVRFTPLSLRQTIKILKKGGVIAHPADTCFGLAADPMNRQAVERVQEIKGRDGQKPMSLMLPMSFKSRIAEFAVLDDFSRRVCEKLLPGPVTVLLPKGPGIPKHYFPETDLIGIRIPDDGLTQALLMSFGGPLVTTSANLSGGELCYTHQEVLQSLSPAPAWPDLVIEGKTEKGPASTVIAVENGKIRVIRKGAMSEKEILERARIL